MWVDSPIGVVSQVPDHTVHEDIEATTDFIRDEMEHFLHVVSDAVSQS